MHTLDNILFLSVEEMTELLVFGLSLQLFLKLVIKEHLEL